MTEPTPGGQSDSSSTDAGGGGRRRASAAAEGVGAPSAVKPLTVGYFTHRDRILGGSHERAGVVVGSDEDGTLHVVPLEHYRVQVDPAEFEPLSADDLA
jgi:hypothetical protein